VVTRRGTNQEDEGHGEKEEGGGSTKVSKGVGTDHFGAKKKKKGKREKAAFCKEKKKPQRVCPQKRKKRSRNEVRGGGEG